MKIKKPKKSKNKIPKLRKTADKLWGQAVFKKWGKKCPLDGREASAPHHCIPKGNCSALRYNIDNGIPLCYHHHHKLHYTGDPRIIQEIIQIRGQEWYNNLLKESKKQVKSNTISYYNQVIEKLTKI